jgi:hypothetical protein
MRFVSIEFGVPAPHLPSSIQASAWLTGNWEPSSKMRGENGRIKHPQR